jgi:hypothetical protein
MSGRISKSIASGLFAVRPLILLAFIAATVLLGFQASKIELNTDIRKMVPLDHPYIQNFLEHQNDLSLGNDVRVIVAETQGEDIFNEDYVNALKEVTDEVFALEGVDPSKIRSLWTSNVRWNEVTEQGFQGGEVIPAGYDGSQDSLEQLRTNVLRSGQVGRLVADNFQSSVVHAYLLDALGDDGVDIPALSARLEEIRGKYQDKYPNVRIHIVGLAKKAGDVMAAAEEVAMFFFFTLGLIALLLLIDTRCLRSALTVTACSFVAVIWQLGIVSSLGSPSIPIPCWCRSWSLPLRYHTVFRSLTPWPTMQQKGVARWIRPALRSRRCVCRAWWRWYQMPSVSSPST